MYIGKKTITMQTIELQNRIIHDVLEIKDVEFLKKLQSLLSKKNKYIYNVSPLIKAQLAKSERDFQTGNVMSNDDVFNEVDKWLNEK